MSPSIPSTMLPLWNVLDILAVYHHSKGIDTIQPDGMSGICDINQRDSPVIDSNRKLSTIRSRTIK